MAESTLEHPSSSLSTYFISASLPPVAITFSTSSQTRVEWVRVSPRKGTIRAVGWKAQCNEVQYAPSSLLLPHHHHLLPPPTFTLPPLTILLLHLSHFAVQHSLLSSSLPSAVHRIHHTIFRSVAMHLVFNENQQISRINCLVE